MMDSVSFITLNRN